MSFIRNFGSFWDPRQVKWGRQNNDGTLLGRSYAINNKPVKKDTVFEFNFRDQIGVYVLYDENENIVYIGESKSENSTIFSRIKNHYRGDISRRWRYFSWYGLYEINTSHDCLIQRPDKEFNLANIAKQIEGLLLHIIEPKLNKKGPIWEGATEFIQVPVGNEDDFEPATKKQIRELKELIEGKKS